MFHAKFFLLLFLFSQTKIFNRIFSKLAKMGRYSIYIFYDDDATESTEV